MVERNPYETNTPVEVPRFMRENTEKKVQEEPKEDVDMSVFKLNEEELNTGSYTRPVETKKKGKKKSKINSLLSIIAIVLALISIVVLVLFFTTNSKYKSLSSEYETYKETSESKIDRLTAENSKLKEENETLKKQNINEPVHDPKKDPENEEKPSSNTTSSSLKPGKYTVKISMYIRTGAGSSNTYASFDSLPEEIKWISNDNSTIVEGSVVNVTEIKTVSDGVWGKIGDNCWICLVNGNTSYIE